MGIILTIALASCNGQEGEAVQSGSSFAGTTATTTAISTVTITKVKKPWYAWRRLVLGKMEKTIPQYRAIAGLDQKLYSFNAKGDRFGGIYFWQREEDAITWFNPSWFEKTKEQFGEVGVVDYYRVRSVMQLAPYSEQLGRYWSVLTRSNTPLDLQVGTKGIIQQSELTNTRGQLFFLTVWADKASAEKFFAGKDLENEYFDTPLVILNEKK